MNVQVPLMGKIYALARRTLVWISELDNSQSLSTCPRSKAAEGDNFDTLCCEPGGSAREHFHEFELREALQRLLIQLEDAGSGNIWWKRLWVSTHLAKSIIHRCDAYRSCGSVCKSMCL